MEQKLNAPRWNLDSIFSGIESTEHQKALKDYESTMDSIDTLLDTAHTFTKEANTNFDFASWLSTILDEQNKKLSLERTLGAYAYLLYSTNTTKPEYLNNISHIEEISIRSEQQNLRMSTLLLAHQTQLEEFYKRFPEYTEYKTLLSETLEHTKHQMSSQEEKLAMDLSRTGGSAWGKLQEQLISNLKDSDGKTFNELRNDAYSKNASLRKLSWQKEIQLLKEHSISFAACLNNLKGETLTLNKYRHWDKALDRALFSSRLKKETLDALVSAIEDSLPVWRTYFKTKAKLLRKFNCTQSETAGKANNEGLAFYDLFAPLEFDSTAKDSLLSKTWTFNEAKEYVLKEYKSFSEDMYTFAKKAFDSSWIDAEVYSGKVGGAYDEDIPLGHQSRILSNFTGSFSDIITLAHELGHAYHFSCMKEKSPLLSDYPMTLAESASTFAETIVKQDMIKQVEGADKLKILDLDLQDTSQVLVDILCRFYFEQSVFEEREKGELNADDFCRLMLNAQERTYGDGLNEEKHEYMWAVKGHYYSTGLDFYNFPYAFGQLFAAGLYQRSTKEGKEFSKTYAELLSQTGSLTCEELCLKAGFDITKKEFWQSGIEMYKKEVEQFIQTASNL